MSPFKKIVGDFKNLTFNLYIVAFTFFGVRFCDFSKCIDLCNHYHT